jgi:hypothetical protein
MELQKKKPQKKPGGENVQHGTAQHNQQTT